MGRVVAVILHPLPGAGAGPLVAELAGARARLAERLRSGLLAAGADEARIVEGPPDDTPFGARLRSLADPLGRTGLVVAGSGAVPLASLADLRPFVEAAASGERVALTNDAYSADIVALGRADLVADVPDLATDNELPRWLRAAASVEVRRSRPSWRLAIDIDSPLDLVLAGAAAGASPVLRAAGRRVVASAPRLRQHLRAVAAVMGDPTAELLVAGRTSARTLRWLETHTASRTRALIEERGLRTAAPTQRPPASVLELLLRPAGASDLQDLVPRLAEAAILDTRVLLAGRLGGDERGWPAAEDRYGSDLLEPDRIEDPWLRSFTASAVSARVPILLGGHTLVGPGVRLVSRAARTIAGTEARER